MSRVFTELGKFKVTSMWVLLSVDPKFAERWAGFLNPAKVWDLDAW